MLIGDLWPRGTIAKRRMSGNQLMAAELHSNRLYNVGMMEQGRTGIRNFRRTRRIIFLSIHPQCLHRPSNPFFSYWVIIWKSRGIILSKLFSVINPRYISLFEGLQLIPHSKIPQFCILRFDWIFEIHILFSRNVTVEIPFLCEIQMVVRKNEWLSFRYNKISSNSFLIIFFFND